MDQNLRGLRLNLKHKIPTSVDNQVKVTSNQFIPTSRNTPRPSTAKESTTTPFVRIPFGPFSLNNQNSENSESEESSDEPSPKVSVSVSTSLSKSSSSSSSTSSETSTPISASTSSSVSKVREHSYMTSDVPTYLP